MADSFGAVLASLLATWEYSPTYALRSALYVLDHAALGSLAVLAGARRPAVFYAIRLALGAKSAGCEAFFVWSVRESYGRALGLWTWFFLLTSAGVFHAAVSFLPSAFAMYFVALSWSFWSPSREQMGAAVACIAVAAIVGWPFAALLGIPLAADIVFSRLYGASCFARYALQAALVVTPPVLLADAAWYGRLTLSTLNVLWYNARPSGAGSALYGTEPWHFYVRNLGLNLGLALPLALLALPLLLAAPQLAAPMSSAAARRLALQLSAGVGWLGFFSCLPHKEERFMFAAYPPLLLGAAVGADALVRALARLRPPSRRATSALALVALVGSTSAALSASRAVAVVRFYNAPLSLYTRISAPTGLPPVGPRARVAAVAPAPGTLCDAPARLCVGSEWHRFPTSLLLPEGTCLSFVRSGFSGILPQPFARVNSTRAIPPAMNDQNRDEPSRYVPLGACHYMVALEDDDDRARLSLRPEWEVAVRLPFLDSRRSPSLTRAFWVPWLSAARNVYGSYVLLRRVG
ncbi:hypothetical protein KFE25_002563 [Diacronema lutheri]|uniref:Mannosyltransferase n=1 Tax=Diacronema lutheri TaxID=2081491 RepID=A0A8J6C5E3_DIALT|nr:hypothetical protein KFE25_002563 [Diacronema lutheri]